MNKIFNVISDEKEVEIYFMCPQNRPRLHIERAKLITTNKLNIITGYYSRKF